MKLYDFICQFENKELDVDTCDTVYDAIVTICYDDDMDSSDDPCSQFTKLICQKVDFVCQFNGAYATVKCDWNKFVVDNMTKLKEYTAKEWKEFYHNMGDDDYIYQWITNIHALIAGYGTDSDYKKLIKLLK